MWLREQKPEEIYTLGSNVDIPKFVAPLHQIKPIPTTPLSSTFFHREFVKFPELTADKLKAFRQGKAKLAKWHREKAEASEKLKVIDNRPEEVR